MHMRIKIQKIHSGPERIKTNLFGGERKKRREKKTRNAYQLYSSFFTSNQEYVASTQPAEPDSGQHCQFISMSLSIKSVLKELEGAATTHV